MPDLKDFVPATRLTHADERNIALNREIEAQKNRTGLWRATKDAVNSEWASSWAIRQFNRSGFEFDPEFSLTDETVKTLGEGLDEDLWSSFEPAVSLGHAQRIREQLVDVQASRQRLAEMGVEGTALRIGAAIFDPAFIAGATVVGFATGGTGAVAGVAGKATRLQRLIRGGLIAAGSEVPIQAYIASQDPEQGIDTVLYSAAGAFALGGAAGAFGPDLARAFKRLRKDVEFSNVIEAAMGSASARELTPNAIRDLEDRVLSKDGALYFKDQLADAKDKRRVVEKMIERSGLDPVADAEEIAVLRELSPDLALRQFSLADVDDAVPTPRGNNGAEPPEIPDPPASAAADGGASHPPIPPKVATDLTIVPSDAESRYWRWARPSMTGKVGKSEVSMIKRAGNAMAQDAVPKKGDAVNHIAASEWINRTFKGTMARYNREVDRAFDEWARAKGVPFTKRLAARAEFNDELGRVIAAPPGTYTDPHLNRAAGTQRKLQAELLGMAQRHGVKGMARVQPHPQYLMRLWRPSLVDKVYAAHGEKGAVEMFAGAIARGSDDLTPDDARAVAKGFLRALRKPDEYTHLELNRAFSVDNADMLERILRENVEGITDNQVENILYTLAPRDREANTIARAKRRMRLDETYTHIFDDGSTLNMRDLMVNDAQMLMNVYARQMIGASAMSEVYRALSTGPDDVIESFAHIESRIIREARARGADAERVTEDLERLRVLYKHNMGLRLNPDTATNRTLRRLRGVNYLQLAGQFGFAQVPEIGAIVGEAGGRVMLQQMPAMRQMFSRARSGALTNESLDFFESVIGSGTDRLNNAILNRMDDIEAAHTFGGGKIDRALERGAKLTNDLSFMAPVNIVLQRTSVLAAAQKLANHAFSGKPMSAARRASLGLSEEDAAAIFEQIRRHAVTTKGALGHTVRDLAVDSWTDQQAAAKMIGALDRWSRRVVQENDIGNMSMWMTKEGGKTLLQFRTFLAVAYEKQFLHRVSTRDWQDFMAVSTTFLFGSMAYVGQTYVNSIGRPDREEFLKERLSPSAIARTGFQRSGFASPITPIIDTASGFTGGPSYFAYGRTTGLDAGAIAGNPTFALIESLYNTGRDIGQSARGDGQFSRNDARALLNLLPFRNVVGVKNTIEAIAGQFPEAE